MFSLCFGVAFSWKFMQLKLDYSIPLWFSKTPTCWCHYAAVFTLILICQYSIKFLAIIISWISFPVDISCVACYNAVAELHINKKLDFLDKIMRNAKRWKCIFYQREYLPVWRGKTSHKFVSYLNCSVLMPPSVCYLAAAASALLPPLFTFGGTHANRQLKFQKTRSDKRLRMSCAELLWLSADWVAS